LAFLHFAYIQHTFVIGSAQENSIISNYNILSSNGKILGPSIQAPSGTTIYDFIAHASEASWSSGAGALPFPGSTSDSRGFACYVNNAILEDGTKWSRVLETHPQWISGGWIAGVYPQQTIQPNTQLTVRIGFLSGATGTDGAKFDVYFDEYRGTAAAPLRYTILSHFATLDGKLDVITKNLNFIAGMKGNFILYVNAGQTSNRDWAVWAEAKIETIPLPDLIITDIWQKENRIYYKIKNIGDASVGAVGAPIKFFNALFIDGKYLAKDYINTIIEPGKEIERYFDYEWRMTLPKHVIKVCADHGENVVEKDEGNNCREETWYLALPDLTLLSMSWTPKVPRVGQSVKFTVVVKNIGNETAGACKGGLWLVNVTKTLIASVDVSSLLPGENRTLILNWTPSLEGVYIIFFLIDYENSVVEANEGNNELLDKINVTRAYRPDLVVIEIMLDRNTSRIGYAIKNIGEDIAKSGHSTTLYVNGKEVDHDKVDVDLKPGEVYKSWFKKYEWPECQNITVKVCADNYNQVEESNEENNCLEKIGVSYYVPIIITSGPRVINVTQDSVTVIWSTNKKSDSAVIYSDRSTGEVGKVYDANMVKDHELKITGLKPRTTYRFYVGSKDICGYVVTSKSMVFETISPPDKEKPSVTLFLPERLVGIVNIEANASDNVGVGGVIFSIDGTVKFMDFSPPYVWVCNTTLFSNGVHSFSAKAFDAAGNEAIDTKDGTIDNPMPDRTPPLVRIIKPSSEWVHDLVEIEALIQDDPNATKPAGYIQEVELHIDGRLVERQVYAPFHIDPFRGELIVNPKRSNLTITHLWNATGLEPNSEHTIEVKAWDNSGNYGHDSIRVKIFSMMPIGEYLEKIRTGVIKIIDIKVTRNVVRHENWFDVSLTINNTGTTVLENFNIIDPCISFQAMALPMPETSRDTSVLYDRVLHRSLVEIKPLMNRLNPGESWTFHYYAVPIVFDFVLCIEGARAFQHYPYIIGGFETYISFQCEGVTYRKYFSIPCYPDYEDWDGNGISELQDAFNVADYLIITNPKNLFESNPTDRDGVNLLLQEIAVLAKIKHGVLGYLELTDTPGTLKNLLNPYTEAPSSIVYTTGGTYKYDKLVSRLPAFRGGRNVYLLIVGEDDVVPAKNVIIDEENIICSDNYYADIIGNDGIPDLIVGRGVGENARELIKPINASISVYLRLKEFDYLNVLAVTGYEWGECFVADVENISRTLEGQGFRVDRVHTDTYDITESFLKEAIKKAIEFYNENKVNDNGVYFRNVARGSLRNIDRIIQLGATPDYDDRLSRMTVEDLLSLMTIEEAEWVEEYRRGIHLDYTLWNNAPYVIEYIQGQRAIEIKRVAPNKGVILWYGHGLPGGWGCVLDAGENTPASIGFQSFHNYSSGELLGYGPIDFGRSCPIVFAWSCETGRYNNLYGMPEAFFHYGAAVYIGSTMETGGSPVYTIFFSSLKRYLDGGCSIGLLFRDMRLEIYEREYVERPIVVIKFLAMFNYYGDPKYGGRP
jgi:hypothetical protein